MDVALEKLEFTGDLAEEEELGDTMSERYEIGTGLTQALGRWQRVLFLRLSDETTTVPARRREPEFETRTSLIIPGHQLFDAAELCRRRQAAALSTLCGAARLAEHARLGSLVPAVALAGRAHVRFRASAGSLRLRGEIGASLGRPRRQFSICRHRNASSPAAIAACAASISNELSPPRRPEPATRVGGKHLLTGTIEVERDLPRNFGVAAFYDIGNAFNDFGDPQFEYSVGLGVRYHIAVASFGVDVAQPLSESGRNPKLHLYISTLF